MRGRVWSLTDDCEFLRPRLCPGGTVEVLMVVDDQYRGLHAPMIPDDPHGLILRGAGLVNVAEDKVLVTGLKGPLEEGWQKKVAAFAARIPIPINGQGADNGQEPARAVPPIR
jgi:hypothetical protein